MKQSIRKAIMSKQSGAYARQTIKPPTISAMQRLKSFPGSGRFITEAEKDRIAEEIMNQGWSRSSNPICLSCFVQKSLSGSCNC